MPNRPPAQPDSRPTLGQRMKKRVHEIAKERGLPTKAVVEQLRAAGIDVKAASSSVDDQVVLRALGDRDGGAAPAPESAASAPRAATSTAPPPSPPAAAPPSGDDGAKSDPKLDSDAAHKRPTRDSLQGERAPGSRGGRRRVVLGSEARRR